MFNPPRFWLALAVKCPAQVSVPCCFWRFPTALILHCDVCSDLCGRSCGHKADGSPTRETDVMQSGLMTVIRSGGGGSPITQA